MNQIKRFFFFFEQNKPFKKIASDCIGKSKRTRTATVCDALKTGEQKANVVVDRLFHIQGCQYF